MINHGRGTEVAGVREMPNQALSVCLETDDGRLLGGFLWRHGGVAAARPIVIISAATSVRCRYYSRFADYLFLNGFDVLTFGEISGRKSG